MAKTTQRNFTISTVLSESATGSNPALPPASGNGLKEYLIKGFVLDDDHLKTRTNRLTILMNCCGVFRISADRKNASIRKLLIYLIRYDNERGKGDHRHKDEQEDIYVFISVEQLIQDFKADIESLRGEYHE